MTAIVEGHVGGDDVVATHVHVAAAVPLRASGRFWHLFLDCPHPWPRDVTDCPHPWPRDVNDMVGVADLKRVDVSRLPDDRVAPVAVLEDGDVGRGAVDDGAYRAIRGWRMVNYS